jgi:hypothetical protein
VPERATRCPNQCARGRFDIDIDFDIDFDFERN